MWNYSTPPALATRFIEVAETRRMKSVTKMTAMQRTFFFNITHELRTPLNSIIGFNTLAMVWCGVVWGGFSGGGGGGVWGCYKSFFF